jgi:hypothetical protein
MRSTKGVWLVKNLAGGILVGIAFPEVSPDVCNSWNLIVIRELGSALE